MTHERAKNQDERSVSSKDRMEKNRMNERTDGRYWMHYWKKLS